MEKKNNEPLDYLTEMFIDKIDRTIVAAMKYDFEHKKQGAYFEMLKQQKKDILNSTLKDIFAKIEKENKRTIKKYMLLPKFAIIQMIQGIDFPPYNTFQFLEEYKLGCYIGGFKDEWEWAIQSCCCDFNKLWLIDMYLFLTKEKYSKDLDFQIVNQ